MLKDLGHSTYSFTQSLLDEDSYIDASGLVVLRHTVGEVNNSQYFIFPAYLATRNALECEAQCGAWHVRHEMSIYRVGRLSEPFFAVC